MCRYTAPTIECSEQSIDRCLQRLPVIAHVAGFSERLVDGGIERYYATDELASVCLRVRVIRLRAREQIGKSRCDLGRQIGERHCEPPSRATQVGHSENDASA